MRTTAEENARMGRWIGDKLNQMEAPVRFLIPEGGVSAARCARGNAFHDPAADKALFEALETTVRQTSTRQLVRLPHNINDPEFVHRPGHKPSAACMAWTGGGVKAGQG